MWGKRRLSDSSGPLQASLIQLTQPGDCLIGRISQVSQSIELNYLLIVLLSSTSGRQCHVHYPLHVPWTKSVHARRHSAFCRGPARACATSPRAPAFNGPSRFNQITITLLHCQISQRTGPSIASLDHPPQSVLVVEVRLLLVDLYLFSRFILGNRWGKEPSSTM